MKRLFMVAGLILMLGSCYNDKFDKLYPPVVNPCDTTNIKYSTDVQPIIATNCYRPGSGCHDAAGAAASGYDFETNVSRLQDAVANGRLLGSIHWQPGFSQMPKNNPKLSDCEINKITRWVHQGAPNN
ncbi:MAG: hypothetical protein K0Q79_1062 [Flavipsychrobacter sp.]|jgi:hypothetical protein|nr:hypothetical protein [Flavipsychrobacter sp.]